MVDYQSLYRRYRPQRFAEVRGQDHVVNALRHAARDDRIAHAYLFSGPRGTGKTSTARILAKALNCSNPVEGEPCGTCDSCTDIARGASFDVHELDAASNNGVDAMRDLVARASLATPGRWKVYIVDEVHMLSPAASNALLKTLEEPPDHVVFVLATTDPQKVLPTIRSRTQHYEFHLLDAEVLAQLLAEIASDAQLELPETAVEAAVRRGRGSARDALSALDQVVASGVVEDDSPFLYELLVSLVERDTRRALQAVESAHVAGRDAPRIATELLDELRGQFLGAVAPGLAREGETSPSVTGPASPHGGLVLLIGPARTVRAMEVLGTAMVAMRDALDARITLEVALVRLTHPEADDDPAALLERIERLERRVQDLTQGALAPPPPAPPVIPPPHAASPPAAPPPPRAGLSPPAPPAAATPPAPPAATPPAGPAPPAAAAPPVAAPPVAAPPAGAAPPAATPPPPADQPDSSPADSDFASQPALGAFRPAAAESHTPPRATEPPAKLEAPAKEETVIAAPPENDVAPPTRDEFVAAWGDHVLSQLRPRVRAVFAVGRFVATDKATAILALPNSAHVERAEAQADEVAEALGRYFGRPIGLRLIAESDVGGATFSGTSDSHVPEPAANGQRRSAPTPLVAPGSQSEAPVVAGAARVVEPEFRPVREDSAEEMIDPNDLDPHGEHVAGDALSWAQDRLMEAFPGAEEV